MSLSRRAVLIGLAASPAALAAVPVFAAEPPVFQSAGIAINGYDPVAYVVQGAAVQGRTAHQSTLDGAMFQFDSAEHKAMFDADPAAFAPQYGGYCAYAAAQGYVAPTAPDAWSVHGGKLYLNYNKLARARWALSKDRYVEQADANWPGILG